MFSELRRGEVLLRPSNTTYLIFVGIWLVIAAVNAVAFVPSGEWRSMVCLDIFFGVLFYFPILRLKIELMDSGLIYRGAISNRRVDLRDVRKYRVQTPSGSYRDRNNPTLGLAIFCKGKSKDPAVIINIKPFSREDIKFLMDRLDRAIDENKAAAS
jgi:hypothetical protein